MPLQADPKARRPVTYERARRLFERAVEDRELCPWCFARRKRYFPEEDEAAANELRWGATKLTLEAMGHRIEPDGSLHVSTGTSEPEPGQFYEAVPETVIDGEFKRSRQQSICVCGVIDHKLDESRSLSVLHDCVDHLAKWYARLDLSTMPDAFDAEAAHDMTTRLRQYDRLSGQDKIVLTEALRAGLCR